MNDLTSESRDSAVSGTDSIAGACFFGHAIVQWSPFNLHREQYACRRHSSIFGSDRTMHLLKTSSIFSCNEVWRAERSENLRMYLF